jgi:hypothetical protein
VLVSPPLLWQLALASLEESLMVRSFHALGRHLQRCLAGKASRTSDGPQTLDDVTSTFEKVKNSRVLLLPLRR